MEHLQCPTLSIFFDDPPFERTWALMERRTWIKAPFWGPGDLGVRTHCFNNMYIGRRDAMFAGEIRPLPRFEGFAPKISRLRGFVSEVRGADDQLLPAGDRIRRRFQLIA